MEKVTIEEMRVPETIMQQLGGQRFVIMTGAKYVLGDKNSVRFQIMRNSKKVTHVIIRLNDRDTYDMEFLKARGCKVAVLSEVSGVYCDGLQGVFTQETGLDTHL
jgi:hypothetical protein